MQSEHRSRRSKTASTESSEVGFPIPSFLPPNHWQSLTRFLERVQQILDDWENAKRVHGSNLPE